MKNSTDMDHPIKDSIGQLMNVAAFRLREPLAARMQELGIDVCVWPVLVCLWEQDDLPQARIAELIGAAGYVVSRNVDRLEAAGYVERRVDPENRRVRRVFLTPDGRQLQEELMPIAEIANDKALEALAPDECCVLKRLLKKIVAKL